MHLLAQHDNPTLFSNVLNIDANTIPEADHTGL